MRFCVSSTKESNGTPLNIACDRGKLPGYPPRPPAVFPELQIVVVLITVGESLESDIAQNRVPAIVKVSVSIRVPLEL